LSNNTFFKNRAIDDEMWKNIIQPYRSQMAVCWKPKATNTHLEYVTLIVLLLQLWLHKCKSLLDDTLSAWLRR